MSNKNNYQSPLTGKRKSSEKISPYDKILKRTHFGWNEFLKSLPTSRDDYLVSYYITNSIDGPAVTQEDRDYIARAMAYFSHRGKRMNCPASETVTAELPMDIQGLTTNRAANNPLDDVFRSAKHIHAMCKYINETRGINNNIIINISVDGSPFYPVF